MYKKDRKYVKLKVREAWPFNVARSIKKEKKKEKKLRKNNNNTESFSRSHNNHM